MKKKKQRNKKTSPETIKKGKEFFNSYVTSNECNQKAIDIIMSKSH